MSRPTSEYPAPVNTASMDRLNHSRFSHTKNASATNGFPALHADEKSPRSIFKTFKKLTHRTKQSRGSSADLSNIEISQPVLVSHRTAAEIVSSVINNHPTDILPAMYSPDPTVCHSPTRKVSKSLPAKSAAKIILSSLPPPPPVLPAKNPSRTAKQPSLHNSNSSIDNDLKPSLPNQEPIEFDYTSEDTAESSCPLTPASHIPSLCQDTRHCCAHMYAVDASCQTSSDLQHTVDKLTAQNEFLLQELNQTKRLLANEIGERQRIASAMQKSRAKLDSISCQAYAKLQEMIDESRHLCYTDPTP
ncbi:hypothetical protein DSO57_1036558 [Entomophthora muscae]|uniref:Uncharacterized protein n=1 Tax=Entomophthora muscae TaxID=34485 RepID=A0ACC2RDW3_9FUNG|nr:hypothetical protein DSO57_1036558 [Entomophthora muscae]